MIDHLQDLLSDFDHLPDEAQAEALVHIKALLEFLDRDVPIHQRTAYEEQWVDPAGAWSDLPDDMLEELDRLRHI
ncbi:MAG TPA: hypothetical protein DHW02_15140 [Ktedonobacter sp.]|nr:hypothetical protein [Ktedonobacter sp.]